MGDKIDKTFTCIICPVGCQINVCGVPGTVESMEGHTCNRGKDYAEEEFCHPTRILTSTVLVKDGLSPLLPVRSDAPVPKELLFDCMRVIKNTVAVLPIKIHDIVISDILGSGVNIIATGNGE